MSAQRDQGAEMAPRLSLRRCAVPDRAEQPTHSGGRERSLRAETQQPVRQRRMRLADHRGRGPCPSRPRSCTPRNRCAHSPCGWQGLSASAAAVASSSPPGVSRDPRRDDQGDHRSLVQTRLGEQVAPRYRSGEPARQIKDDVDIGAGLTARRNHGWAELHQFAGVLIQVEARRGVPPSQRRNTEVRLTHRWRKMNSNHRSLATRRASRHGKCR
jgi:hypothetical protein